MTTEDTDLEGAIAAAVILRDSRVLLIRRRHREGSLLWALPSGGVEPGETAEEAAVRETMEEVGLPVMARRVLGERIHPATGRRMVYVACEPDETITAKVVDTDEVADLTWANRSDVLQLVPSGLFEAVQRYLDDRLS